MTIPFYECVDSMSDLGVVFQSDLRFYLHINNINTKSLRLLIKRNSKYITDTKTIACLYNSLVRSVLEYCSIIWAHIMHTTIAALREYKTNF